MKDILFITFDVKRDDYPAMSYSIAALIATLKLANIKAGHFSIDLQRALEEKTSKITINDIINTKLQDNLKYFQKFRFIAISVTAWSSEYCLTLLEMLNDYEGKIILGGYEITSTQESQLEKTFPRADYFIKGYAEKAIKRILNQECNPNEKFIRDIVTIEDLASPYLSEVLQLNTRKIYWETKRGCIFKCGFCEWGNATKSMIQIDNERLNKEIELIKQSCVDEVNILDGTFNIGREYLNILKKLIGIPDIHITCQARFESLYGKKANEFLKICADNNHRVHLEFGLQTIHQQEMETIGRKNKIEKIERALKLLNANDIDFETSIIYAIPGQTVDSFIDTIEFLIENGCKVIKAYPLQIPKNSKIEDLRESYCVNEKKDKYNVKSVSSTYSFPKEQRVDMDKIVKRLISGKLMQNNNDTLLKRIIEDCKMEKISPFLWEIKSINKNAMIPELFERISEDYISPTLSEIDNEDVSQGMMMLGKLHSLNSSRESYLKNMSEIISKNFFYELKKTQFQSDEIDIGLNRPMKVRVNLNLIPKRYYCKVRISKSGNIYVYRDIKLVNE